MKIKITTGFSDDQKFTIDSEEAHKAYYLFNNPEKKGIFSNGVALIGKDIRSIQPDYHAEMGWNPSHRMDDDDWNELRAKEIDKKMRNILYEAKKASYLAEKNSKILNKPLSKIENLLLK